MRLLELLRGLKLRQLRQRVDLPRVLACVILGGIAGYLLVPSRHGHAEISNASGGEVGVVAASVSLEGHLLPIHGEAAEHTLDAARVIARGWSARKVIVSIAGGPQREASREELGARVDGERLAALVAQLRDPRSALRRAHRARMNDMHDKANPPLRVPLPVVIDGARALRAMTAIKDDVDRAPVDARLDLGGDGASPATPERGRIMNDGASPATPERGRIMQVLSDEPGRRMDVHATLARLEAAIATRAAEGGDEPITIEAVVETVPASRSASQLGDVQVGDVIGWFETKYARDLKHEARTFNLRLAASKLDGHVLMPGDVFDFNDVVGPRSEANGYKIAPVIAQGELVDGIGGGTCQIAGSLHGAAFFAGLDIVERKPHTRPSFYIKMGMDAAVAYPTITLRLRNPFPYPVVLHETVQGGVVRAEILGPKRTRDVTFVRKMADVTPFQEKEVPDPKIPKGERVLAQRGIPGFKITRYRLLRDGSFAVRERMQDTYPSTTQIWKVGTGDPDPKFEPRDDEHPEYVADEYLAISQGPHIVVPRTGQPSIEPGGAMVESRVAGRYGTHGWTEREGFAKNPGRGHLRTGTRTRKLPGTEDDPGVD